MTDIVIPSLSGIARMVPVHGTALISNVGPNWTATGYTVPTGRILVLDTVILTCFGGTLPTFSEIAIHDGVGTRQARVARESYTVRHTPVYTQGSLWLAEAWTLRFGNNAGDSSTDMMWSFSGRLFDWVDVT